MEARRVLKLEPLPFELALRIRHPSMDPAEVSRELGLVATHSFRAGDPRPARTAATPAVYGESYWLGALDPTAWPADAWASGFSDLDVAVKALRKATTRSLGWAISLSVRRILRARALVERIHIEGGQVSLLVALAPTAVESFNLAPDVSRILSDLGITLEFDLSND